MIAPQAGQPFFWLKSVLGVVHLPPAGHGHLQRHHVEGALYCDATLVPLFSGRVGHNVRAADDGVALEGGKQAST